MRGECSCPRLRHKLIFAALVPLAGCGASGGRYQHSQTWKGGGDACFPDGLAQAATAG